LGLFLELVPRACIAHRSQAHEMICRAREPVKSSPPPGLLLEACEETASGGVDRGGCPFLFFSFFFALIIEFLKSYVL